MSFLRQKPYPQSFKLVDVVEIVYSNENDY